MEKAKKKTYHQKISARIPQLMTNFFTEANRYGDYESKLLLSPSPHSVVSFLLK
jgi:hypothetical protein